jgi:VWFA-related protein
VRTVYVTAVDGKGVPVADLTASDFTVKEDGKTREVIKVERATGLVSVALLVDDNGTDINEIRSGLAAFVQRLEGRAEIALISVVPAPVRIVDYTTDVQALMAGIGRLVWRAAPRGGQLLSAIAQAAAELAQREAARPVVVVIAFEGEEYSSTIPAGKVLDQLEQSSAALHVVAVGRPMMRPMGRLTEGPQGDNWAQDNINRTKVLSEGPKQSGGRRHELIVAAGLPKTLDLLADALPHQYAVLYAGSSDGKRSTKLSVSVKRRGVTLRAPTRVR